jgi:hypothetical protein
MGVHRKRYPAGSRWWARSAFDHVEAFFNDVSKLSATAEGSQLTIHGNFKVKEKVEIDHTKNLQQLVTVAPVKILFGYSKNKSKTKLIKFVPAPSGAHTQY